MNCEFCGAWVAPERVDAGYTWCKAASCSESGMARKNNIVLVCGHKAGYQPMYKDDVAHDAIHPRR